MKPTIACVVGTRPEAIKMAPVIQRLQQDESGVDVFVLTTGQHRELLDQALGEFQIRSDHNLALMRANQDLSGLTARALTGLSEVFSNRRPAFALAQGDTTTVLCTALACYYHRIPFGHVEAGLRTGDPYFPFPEEKNRVLAGHLAELHFAPTDAGRQNLLREGINDETIYVTGNTVIDALLMTARKVKEMPVIPKTEKFILVTAHRRENFGKPMEQICLALKELIHRNENVSIVFPVHPNPNVRKTVFEHLGEIDRILLMDPVGYREFVALMKNAFFILTDSGGVQEEGPSLGKPVLVLRDETERPEAVEAGTVRLVGPNRQAIVDSAEELLQHPEIYAQFSRKINPYGDGHASERIVQVLRHRLGIAELPGCPSFEFEKASPELQTAAT